jgi:hypothetical protein
MNEKARTGRARADLFGRLMAADKKALREHIARKTGMSFVDSPFGWKSKCPFEEGSTSQSFFVLDSPEGEFYCLNCKVEGGLAEFDSLWNRHHPAQPPPEAPPQPEKVAQAETHTSPRVLEKVLTQRPETRSDSVVPAPQIGSRQLVAKPRIAARAEESLRRQLRYLQRQNEGLHGLVLKYNEMLSAKGSDAKQRDQDPGSRWISIDFYNDLLDRYERLLVFAGEMQEKERRQQQVHDKDYAELLARYERAVMFAGELQEKSRQQLLLREKTGELAEQVEELKRRARAADSYIELLEKALATLRQSQTR